MGFWEGLLTTVRRIVALLALAVSVSFVGSGSYGTGLARSLAAAGVEVVEVIRPNRQPRRRRGKSDPADAVAAALAAQRRGLRQAEGARRYRRVAAGAACLPPRRGQGVRPGGQLTLTARPDRDRTRAAAGAARPALDRPAGGAGRPLPPGELSDPAEAAKAAMAAVARRHQQLQAEIERLDAALKTLVERAAPPQFVAKQGVGL